MSPQELKASILQLKAVTIVSRKGARKAAVLGHDAIMCPHTECYFDYDQGLREDPAAYPWFSCLLPWERVYAFDPLAGIPPEQSGRVLGAECCNWTEFTCNETELQRKGICRPA